MIDSGNDTDSEITFGGKESRSPKKKGVGGGAQSKLLGGAKGPGGKVRL